MCTDIHCCLGALTMIHVNFRDPQDLGTYHRKARSRCNLQVTIRTARGCTFKLMVVAEAKLIRSIECVSARHFYILGMR